MAEPQPIRFDDGAAYERMMGRWSQPVGAVFLDWLQPPARQRWADIGCGNGAFTELICEQCAPASVDAIDPSEAQLAFARTRPATTTVRYQVGDAMALPFVDKGHDVAVMALVIFFVPDPAKGVAEMVRIVRPGGRIAAYAWDFTRGGFPWRALGEELTAIGVEPPRPPSAEASRIENLTAIWRNAGLTDVETREIVVARTFADFDELWSIACGSGIATPIASLSPTDRDTLKARVQARLPADLAGRITFTARANAIKGRVPVAI